MRRPILYVIMAGLAALVAALVVFSALKKREAMVQQAIAKNVEIVVAAHNLPLGTKIEPSDITLARWSRDSLPPGAFTDPKAIISTFVKSSFVRNEPIVTDKLYMGEKTAGVMPLLIPAGMRAMSVPVDEVSDIAGFVQPGTRVDVLIAVTGNSSNEKPFSRIVLQNVQVLAVAQEIERRKDEPVVVKVVTLLVTPQQAETLALAGREGTLRLAMRNFNDHTIVSTSGVNIADLIRRSNSEQAEEDGALHLRTQAPIAYRAPRQPEVRVEVLRNGKESQFLSFFKQKSSEGDDPVWLMNAHGSDSAPKLAGGIAAVRPASAAGTGMVTPAPAPTLGNVAGPVAEPPAAFVAPVPKTINLP